MSYVILSAIPTDPRWVPDEAQEAAAVATFDELVRHYGSVDIEVCTEGAVRFYDAGEGFESARCPSCQAVVAENPADMTWWAGELGSRWSEDEGFWPLDVSTLCCGAQTSLNDLDYKFSQGFATWSVRAIDAQVWEFDDEQTAALEAALGHPFRLVYAHY